MPTLVSCLVRLAPTTTVAGNEGYVTARGQGEVMTEASRGGRGLTLAAAVRPL